MPFNFLKKKTQLILNLLMIYVRARAPATKNECKKEKCVRLAWAHRRGGRGKADPEGHPGLSVIRLLPGPLSLLT